MTKALVLSQAGVRWLLHLPQKLLVTHERSDVMLPAAVDGRFSRQRAETRLALVRHL